MFTALKKLFKQGPEINFSSLVAQGAQIIDVRSVGEYMNGHVQGSINIPLNVLDSKLKRIRKDRPVITCCASGMRSSTASSLLKSKGYEVYNGGSWINLERKLGI